MRSDRHGSSSRYLNNYPGETSPAYSQYGSSSSAFYKSSSRSERTDRLGFEDFSRSRNGSPRMTPTRMQEPSARPPEILSKASSPLRRGGSPSSRRSSITSLRSSASSKSSDKQDQKRLVMPYF